MRLAPTLYFLLSWIFASSLSRTHLDQKSVANSISNVLYRTRSKRRVVSHRQHSLAVSYNTTSSSINWLILHYHKTGHDLTRKIFRPTATELNVSFHDNFGPRRTLWNLQEFNGAVPYFISGIHTQGGPLMFFRWNSHINNIKILHFVRDPFDYVISAYLYHSQVKTPPESFLKKPFNPCRYSERMFSSYYSELKYFGKDVESIQSSINNITVSCKSMFQRAVRHSTYMNSTRSRNTILLYGNLLRNLSSSSDGVVNALKLEAYRSILSSEVTAGGDIIRMAINSLRAQEAGSAVCRQVTIEEFPYENIDTWKQNYGEILDFLFGDEYPAQLKSQGRRDLPSASIRLHLINLAYNNSMSRKISVEITNSSVHKTRAVHVTKNLLSIDERQRLKMLLMQDPELGPLMKLFQKFIFPSVSKTNSSNYLNKVK